MKKIINSLLIKNHSNYYSKNKNPLEYDASKPGVVTIEVDTGGISLYESENFASKGKKPDEYLNNDSDSDSGTEGDDIINSNQTNFNNENDEDEEDDDDSSDEKDNQYNIINKPTLGPAYPQLFLQKILSNIPCLPRKDIRHVNGFNYDLIKKELNTGDLIFFCGESLISLAIECSTLSDISHVGVIIRSPYIQTFDPMNIDEEDLYIFHSCVDAPSGDLKDRLSGKAHNGPQLNPLRKYIDSYGGYCMIRRLIYAKSISKNIDPVKKTKKIITYRTIQKDEKSSDLLKWMIEVSSDHYESNLTELICAAYRNTICSNLTSESDQGYFCSELVYYFLTRAKFVDPPSNQKYPPRKIIPKDFDSKKNKELYLDKMYSIGNRKYVYVITDK